MAEEKTNTSAADLLASFVEKVVQEPEELKEIEFDDAMSFIEEALTEGDYGYEVEEENGAKLLTIVAEKDCQRLEIKLEKVLDMYNKLEILYYTQYRDKPQLLLREIKVDGKVKSSGPLAGENLLERLERLME